MCLCVCLVGCGVNGHDFPNGASVPTGEWCQECTCEVCLSLIMKCGLNKWKKINWGLLYFQVYWCSVSLRMEMWCVQRSDVLPCLVGTLSIMLENVALGNKLS